MISPDFSEATEFELVPEGIFNTRITKTEVKTSQAGNQYVNWTLDIFGAEGEYEKVNNQKIWHITMCSGKASGMLKKFVKAVTGEDPVPSFDTDDLLGREVEVTIAHRVDQQGEKRASVKAVRALV